MGERPLAIPKIKERIAQVVLKRRLELIFDKEFCDCSFGFRKGRSQIEAINRVEEYRNQGYK